MAQTPTAETLVHQISQISLQVGPDLQPTGKIQVDMQTLDLWFEIEDVDYGYQSWVSPTATERMATGEKLASASDLDDAINYHPQTKPNQTGYFHVMKDAIIRKYGH